ncbi:ABC transporter ATP-binding protein [Mollicutes bacterium LVI A0039]|nr:ABC transporter ATP-binding protein [Mollicutes bacterium LVI A0039]
MFAIFKNLSWYFKEHKRMYILLSLLVIFISYLTTLTPKLIGQLIDYIAMDELTEDRFYILIAGITLLPITVYFLNRFYHHNLNMRGEDLSKEMRIKYLTKLFSSDIELYESYNKGELISRVSNDLLSITQAVTILLSDVTYCFTLLGFILFTMIFTISPKLTLIAFVIIPITFALISILLNHMRKYYRIHRKIFAKFFDSILESLEGMRVVRAYVYEDNDLQKNEKAVIDDINSWKKIVKFETMFTPMFEFVIAISTVLTFVFGVRMVIAGELTPGDLITFSMYITMVSGPILVLANVYNLINQAMIADTRMQEVMMYENKVANVSHAAHVDQFEHLVFDKVCYKYPFSDVNTINKITLEVYAGETIGIVGPSGSGKSTILRQLLRDFNPTSGDIFINGEDFTKLKMEDVRGLVGYVPQSDILFSGTLSENLDISKGSVDEKTKYSAMYIANMDHDIDRMERGINTELGEGGSGLSGGQKQRLSIARAIIKDPQILLLDDSLSAVDANTEKAIISNLRKHRAGRTNIMITHRFSVVKNADRIYVVEKGEIKEVGNHQQLMYNRGWYYEQYLNQTGGEDEQL